MRGLPSAPTVGAPGTGRRPKAVEAVTSPSVTVRPTGGCSTSERAVETDPLLPGTDELLAVSDVLLVVSPDKAAFILPREPRLTLFLRLRNLYPRELQRYGKILQTMLPGDSSTLIVAKVASVFDQRIQCVTA